MPTLAMLIGLPLSGKTTEIENIKKNRLVEDPVLVSADQLRRLVYGQRYYEDGEPLMWSVRRIVLKMLLEQHLDIIVDDTNLTRARRQAVMQLARPHGYEVVGIYMNTPLEICRERGRALGESFTLEVLERMAIKFEAPDAEVEGFNRIYQKYS